MSDYKWTGYKYVGMAGETFIDIANCTAWLAREVPAGRYSTRNVYAANSEEPEIQELLLAEIERQGGAINISGRMYCPPEIAALAKWEETS